MNRKDTGHPNHCSGRALVAGRHLQAWLACPQAEEKNKPFATRRVTLTKAIARQMDLAEARDHQLPERQKDVRPGKAPGTRAQHPQQED